jgi:GAF domain-containing protein/DNA-binding CsgD family transcriptional regulator
MTDQLAPKEVLKLFRRIGETLGQKGDLNFIMQEAATRIGTELDLDRCAVLLLENGSNSSRNKSLSVVADFAAEGRQRLNNKTYQLSENSELFALLGTGKPLPLKDLIARENSSSSSSPLDNFIADSQSKMLVAFPMMIENRVIGCLSMHRCGKSEPFSADVLELGEAVAEVLAAAADRAKVSNDLACEKKFFDDAAFPALLVNQSNLKVRKTNQACQAWLGNANAIVDQTVGLLFADGERLAESLRLLNVQKPLAELCSIAGRDGKTAVMDVSLSLVGSGEPKEALLIFHLAKTGSDGPASDAADVVRLQRAEEMTNTLSKQLSWERWVRQIICKLHATLDRDTLLQTVVDGFGRALGASRCLIVRTDGMVSPMVTHEYVEPDISPLGLGRTGQFPPAAVSFFRHKVGAIADLSALEKSGQLTVDEYEYFAENGVRSMAGAPIASHGVHYGVIVILECGPIRKWVPHELDMLEIAASQTAVALGHSQSYLQLKDQLFNMNLLGNLTQQLTSTLELVSRGTKSDGMEEKAKQSSNAPPLSLRELEVLKLIASGLANREIAQRLFLTESTVELHASRIRKKLKLKSRTALVKYACDNGLA